MCIRDRFVSFRDSDLERLVSTEPRSLTDLQRCVIAGDFQKERTTVLKRLQRLGVWTIEAPVGRVTPKLIGRYLEVKRREMV